MAIEVAASGVRVNAVAPGPTDTGMLDRFTDGDKGKAFMAAGVHVLPQISPVEGGGSEVSCFKDSSRIGPLKAVGSNYGGSPGLLEHERTCRCVVAL